jgi:hypothetical protein
MQSRERHRPISGFDLIFVVAKNGTTHKYVTAKDSDISIPFHEELGFGYGFSET